MRYPRGLRHDIPFNCEFTRIYQPWGHQPAVYSCDAPEEHCPVCLSNRGMLAPCTECGRYQYPFADLGDWDDPLISREEAQQLCSDCLEIVRVRRTEER